MAGILVFSENIDLAQQILGKARQMADHLEVQVAALATQDPGSYPPYGADVVYLAEDPALEEFALEPYRAALLEAVKQADPELIAIGATKRGKELAPRVAAALGVGCMTDCIGLEVGEEGRLVAQRLTYGGSTIATETCHSNPTVITVPARVFEKQEPSERVAETIKIEVELPEPRVKVVERRPKSRGEADLENASIIVSAGRGFKAKEDLRLLEELAGVLGASMGCTRPVSADLGWMDEWVGISGKKVKPRLYVACGISGTIQHMAGIRDSQIIVSINSDESAGIHGQSDYSLVGDIYEILPALTRALRERA